MGKISLLFLISHGSEVFVLAQGMLITITVSYGGDIIKQLNMFLMNWNSYSKLNI